MKLLPEWINKEVTPGRDSAADKKMFWMSSIAFTAISITLSIVLYFGDGIPTDNFRAASGILKFLSVLAAIFSIWGIWKAPDLTTGKYWLLIILPIAISWFFAYVEGNGYN